MIRDVLGYIGLAAFGWWLWTGPIHDMRTVSEEETLKLNAQNMARCIETREFASSLTAPADTDPERACARKYGLYRNEGRWVAEKPPGD